VRLYARRSVIEIVCVGGGGGGGGAQFIVQSKYCRLCTAAAAAARRCYRVGTIITCELAMPYTQTAAI